MLDRSISTETLKTETADREEKREKRKDLLKDTADRAAVRPCGRDIAAERLGDGPACSRDTDTGGKGGAGACEIGASAEIDLEGAEHVRVLSGEDGEDSAHCLARDRWWRGGVLGSLLRRWWLLIGEREQQGRW